MSPDLLRPIVPLSFFLLGGVCQTPLRAQESTPDDAGLLAACLDPARHAEDIVAFGRRARYRSPVGRRAADEALSEHDELLRARLRTARPDVDDRWIDAALAYRRYEFPLLRAVQEARAIVAFGPRPAAGDVLEALVHPDAGRHRAALRVLEDDSTLATSMLPELEQLYLRRVGIPPQGDASRVVLVGQDPIREPLAKLLLDLPVDERVYAVIQTRMLDDGQPSHGPVNEDLLRGLRRLVERPVQAVGVRYRVIAVLEANREVVRSAAVAALATFEVSTSGERSVDREEWSRELEACDDPLGAWELRGLLAWRGPTDAGVASRLQRRLETVGDSEERQVLERLLRTWDQGGRARGR